MSARSGGRAATVIVLTLAAGACKGSAPSAADAQLAQDRAAAEEEQKGNYGRARDYWTLTLRQHPDDAAARAGVARMKKLFDADARNSVPDGGIMPPPPPLPMAIDAPSPPPSAKSDSR